MSRWIQLTTCSSSRARAAGSARSIPRPASSAPSPATEIALATPAMACPRTPPASACIRRWRWMGRQHLSVLERYDSSRRCRYGHHHACLARGWIHDPEGLRLQGSIADMEFDSQGRLYIDQQYGRYVFRITGLAGDTTPPVISPRSRALPETTAGIAATCR